MKKSNPKNRGAAAIVAAIVVSGIILSISLTTGITALNNQIGAKSFVDSMQAFYSSEAGLGEAIMQLRREPTNFIFNPITVGSFEVNAVFVEDTGCTVNCLTNIESTATNDKASRKVKYSCDNDISDCRWFELIP